MMRNEGQEIKVKNEKFNQNVITFHFVVFDESSSMQDNNKERGVKKGANTIHKNLLAMENPSATRICKVVFGSKISKTDLVEIEDFDPSYCASGGATLLYDTIIYLCYEINRIYKEYSINRGYKVNINVVFLSDGEDWNSTNGKRQAIDAIKELKEITKASLLFTDIGYANTEVAKELGFIVKSIDGTEESIEEYSQEISQMLVESSQSGTTIENLSKMMSSSNIASEEYKELMGQTSAEDPLSSLFDYA